MKRSGARFGFSLIELIVVIAIIGILTALLLSAVSRSKSRAHNVACNNRLRQIGLGLQMYAHDNSGKYPHLRGLPDADETVDYDTRWWWAKLLPYYPIKWTDRAYHCPGYKGAITNGHRPLGSYAYNWRGVAPPIGPYPAEDTQIQKAWGLGVTIYLSFPGPAPANREGFIKVPSEMLAIGESRFLSEKVNGIPGGECALVCGFLDFLTKGPKEFAFGERRHGKNYNQLFCDGHVAGMDPWVVFNPTNSAAMWNYDNKPHPELWPPH